MFPGSELAGLRHMYGSYENIRYSITINHILYNLNSKLAYFEANCTYCMNICKLSTFKLLNVLYLCCA